MCFRCSPSEGSGSPDRTHTQNHLERIKRELHQSFLGVFREYRGSLVVIAMVSEFAFCVENLLALFRKGIDGVPRREPSGLDVKTVVELKRSGSPDLLSRVHLVPSAPCLAG